MAEPITAARNDAPDIVRKLMAENERLKAELEDAEIQRDGFQEQWQVMYAENERLKTELDTVYADLLHATRRA